MKDSKLYELTVGADGIRLRHCNPSPLSAEQKYNIILALIGAAVFLGFIGFIGFMTAH